MQALAPLDITTDLARRSPREHIRHVALEMFVERGFHSVSLRQLASAAGMQAGSLYNHIESKDALLFDLINGYERELLQAIGAGDDPDADPVKALDVFIRAHVGFTSVNRQHWQLAKLEFRCLERDLQAQVQALRDEVAGCLRSILESGIRHRRFARVSISAMVPCMLTVLNEVSGWHSHGTDSSLDACVGLHTLMFDALLRPSRAATPR